MSASGGTRAIVAALAANLGIAITKFIAFLISGSSSMLAESVHSVADTGNELLLLIGSGRSRRARTELHPFGFGEDLDVVDLNPHRGRAATQHRVGDRPRHVPGLGVAELPGPGGARRLARHPRRTRLAGA